LLVASLVNLLGATFRLAIDHIKWTTTTPISWLEVGSVILWIWPMDIVLVILSVISLQRYGETAQGREDVRKNETAEDAIGLQTVR
jgi:hypothetical protein